MSSFAPRTILMTADTVGGVWTYSLELARALRPYSVNIVLATMGRRLTPRQREDSSGISNLQLHESDYKLEWMQDPWKDVAAAGDWLLSLEQVVHPDVVHLNGYSHACLPWNSPVVVAGHSCIFSWWQAVHGGLPPAEWTEYRKQVTAGLQAADVVVAPSNAMLRSLRDLYGPLPRAIVIPNGRLSPLRCSLPKEDIIFSAGRLWDAAKNAAALEAVAGAVSWPVYLAGDREGSPGGGARYLGFLSSQEVLTWCTRARVYALPAKYEPFGLSVLEAALCKCALVLGDIPSLREIWGSAAVYVHPDDRGQLASALGRLIDRPEELEEMARRAANVARSLSPGRMAAGYFELYRSLLASSPYRQPNAFAS